jgi:hypothetical protein
MKPIIMMNPVKMTALIVGTTVAGMDVALAVEPMGEETLDS